MLTIFVALLVLPSQSAAEKKATLEYLAGLQTAKSGFKPDAKADGPTLRGTSASLRAIKYFGGTVTSMGHVRDFVLSCRDRDTGGFADKPNGTPDVAVTSVGLMALTEIGYNTGKIAPPAIAFMSKNAKTFEQIRMTAAGLEVVKMSTGRDAEWIEMLTKEQNPDGTFGKDDDLARETGGKVACLLRLGGKVKDADRIVKALDAAQREDGGFGVKSSDLESSYRVIRTYHMLKRKPAKPDALKAFIASCRNEDGGYGVAPGKPSSAGGTYFAGIVLHWLAAK
jgi:prenyltransferase beta subunit